MTADRRSLFLHLPLRGTHEFLALTLVLTLVFTLAAQPALALFVGGIVSEIAIDSL